MPSSDWIQITIRTPLLLLPVLAILLIVLAGGVVTVLRRQRIKLEQVEDLRTQLDQYAEREAQWTSAREAYRHFVYNVSHEVANPLQSIQTNLDNMATCSVDEEGRWRQHHQIIVAEVRRLVRLMDNLRLLSRLETPDAPTVREPVNLRAVTEDVIMSLYDESEKRGVRLRYFGPSRPARVMGDRDRLRQVLLNLVDNGIKYSRGNSGEVVIGIEEEGDRLRVRVSDQGVGIAEEDLPHIFDTAYRVPDSRSLRQKGSGLGLAIVQQIVRQHGGEVMVHSRIGEGTTFSFDLPLYVPSQYESVTEPLGNGNE